MVGWGVDLIVVSLVVWVVWCYGGGGGLCCFKLCWVGLVGCVVGCGCGGWWFDLFVVGCCWLGVCSFVCGVMDGDVGWDWCGCCCVGFCLFGCFCWGFGCLIVCLFDGGVCVLFGLLSL